MTQILHPDHLRFIFGLQRLSYITALLNDRQHINRMNGRSHMIIIVDAENSLHKIQHPFHTKITSKSVAGMYLNTMRPYRISEKLTLHSMVQC